MRDIHLPHLEATMAARENPEPRAVTTKPNKSRVWTYVAAASLSIALLSSFMGYDFYQRWQQIESAYKNIANSNEVLAQQNNKMTDSLKKLQEDVNTLINPDYSRVDLNPVIEGQPFSATVYWNKKTGEVYLSAKVLSSVSEGQEHQFWAIVEGKSVALGFFDFDLENLTEMKSVSKATSFLISVEPKGGSDSPTREAIEVAGKVR